MEINSSRDFPDLSKKQRSSYHPISKNKDESETDAPINKLSEDLIDKIFISLPTADGIRAGCISKKWQLHKNLCTNFFSFDDVVGPSQKPWYFMYQILQGCLIGFSYDSEAESWHDYDFQYLKAGRYHICNYSLKSPRFEPDRCLFSTSNGLVCIMYIECDREYIFVCNPILKLGIMLPQLPDRYRQDCFAVALSVDINSKSYYVAVVNASHSYGDMNYQEQALSIELYDSTKNSWTNLYDGWLAGADADFECVICNNTLYYLITFNDAIGTGPPRQAVVPYNMTDPKFENALTDLGIVVPGILTCVRLMNLCDKLIMVGGLESNNFEGSIEAIHIWELCGKEWKEITRMPEEIMDILPDFDGSFASKGSGDFVYVHGHASTDLAIFDMRKKSWQLVTGAPARYRYDSYGDIGGICFEPRLDIRP